ncbi:predicted protein [Plenodomus lingam JN3]|uniref:Uncharacterized protein n=1 Tax=Leptosphaeria maculans (strain JN3 / isolate v23.1.3 / race Av1-4-5-6-7-8) TaxID=985895 RepID=E5A7H9_LEPMJ|nr:predicted protein [Plenodomus lingam JN3]CBX99574.1 predicted protein [Plenodomus lingam JN3]
MALAPSPESNDINLWSRNRYLDVQDPPPQPCLRRNAIVEIPSDGKSLAPPLNSLPIIPSTSTSTTATAPRTAVSTALFTEKTGDPTFFSSAVTSAANGSVAAQTRGAETATHSHPHSHSGSAVGTGQRGMGMGGETGGALREAVEMVVVLLVGVAFAVSLLL